MRFFLLLLCSPLCAETVKIVANFGIDPVGLSQSVQETGLQIVCSDLSEYGETLHKKKSKLFEKWGLVHSSSLVDPKAHRIVLWNLTSQQRHHYDLSKLPAEKLVLFMWEPPTVLPKMYAKKYHSYFGRIYTLDDRLVDNRKYFKLYYPDLKPMRDPLPSFEEKKLCTLIAGFHKSSYNGELYSERVRVIEFFECKPEGEFEFYGRGWKPGCYRNYRGVIEDKLSTLEKYRFCICYENTKDMPGYITEKIFDCFAAGSVPIYWGAPNIEAYIPSDCFIDKRNFSNEEQLYAFLKAMNKETYENYLSSIRRFLASDQAQVFSRETFTKIFKESITAQNSL